MKTFRIALLALGLALPAVVGCGGGGSSDSSNVPSGPGTPLTNTSRQIGSLRFDFSTSKYAYAVGESVPISFRVTNTGTTAFTATRVGTDSAISDAVVASGMTTPAYPVTGYGDATTFTLAAGASTLVTLTWNQKDAAGTTVVAGRYVVSPYFRFAAAGDTSTHADAVTNGLEILIL